MRSATQKRIGKCPAYLRFIRTLACICCALGEVRPRDRAGMWRGTAWEHIEAAHTGPHGLGQKSDDYTAIPLCMEHHRLGRDSYHRLGKKFFEHQGIDRIALIRELNERYAGKTGTIAAR